MKIKAQISLGGITISTVIAYHLLSILLIDKVEN